MKGGRRGGSKFQYTATRGNRLTLYTDGDDAFEAAYEAIRNARERVWLETYIFEPDEVGNMARDALVEAARRGCSVILLFDRWGSPRLGVRYAQPIIEAGGRVAVYNPVFPWQKLGRKIAPAFHRDHRKILIADDTGFCGGANVSRDYGGPGPEAFFDLTVKVEGPSVHHLAALFLGTLREATGAAPQLPPRAEPYGDGAAARILALDRRHQEDDLDLALEHALHRAERQCLLMTPYFVPPEWFTETLIGTAARGVDVRILTAGRSDVPLARVAGRHLYRRLLQAGIRVFEMQDPILHAKCISIDDRYSIIGSYNVDAYGGKHNLEVGVATSDERLAGQIAAEFERHAQLAREITPGDWDRRPRRKRIIEWLLYVLFSM